MADDEAYQMLTETLERLKETYSSTYGMAGNELCVYTENLWTEIQLLEDVQEEVYHAISYEDYLFSIEEDAKRMLGVSIFQDKTAFSTRNIEKTVEDFAEMKGILPEASKSKGITMATDFLLTDLIGVLLLFVLCVYLVLYEKQSGQFALISPTAGGRRETLLAKISVLLFSVILIYVILYGGNFMLAWKNYGFGNLSRAVQSVPAYQSSILKLTVREYFLLFTAVKIGCYFMAGLFLLLLCLRMKRWAGIVGVALAVFGGNFAASFLIPENGAFMSIKYLNLVSFLQTDHFLMDYQNVNLFGYPISLVPIGIIVMAILMVIFTAWILIPAEQTEILWTGKLYQVRRKRPAKTGYTLCYFELLKARKNGGLVFFAILLLGVQLFRIQQYSYFQEPDEIYYRTYMTHLSELTEEEMNTYVEEENERYNSLLSQEVTDENRQELKQEFLPYKGWLKTVEEYERIRQSEGLELVYPSGYLQLMGEDKSENKISMMVLMLFLCLCLPGVFAGDYEGGVNSLLKVTAKGRKDTLRAKKKIAMGIAVLAFVYVSITDFLMFYLEIGMSKPNAPLQSIRMFEGVTLELKIWQYLVLMYLIKLLGVIVSVYVIRILSKILKDTMRVTLLSIVLFVFPVFLK